MKRAKIPVDINGIQFDALIDSEESYTAKAPSYPTDDGFIVNDTVILEPLKLSMTLFVSEKPVTWRKLLGSGRLKVEQVVDDLRVLFNSRQIVSVTTTDYYYDNMVVTSLTIPKSVDVGYAREIKIELTQVKVTYTKTVDVSVSYTNSGSSKSNSGRAQTKKVASSEDDPTAGINKIGYEKYLKQQQQKEPSSELNSMFGGLYNGKYTNIYDLAKSTMSFFNYTGGK